jgi:hypothetical protein
MNLTPEFLKVKQVSGNVQTYLPEYAFDVKILRDEKESHYVILLTLTGSSLCAYIYYYPGNSEWFLEMSIGEDIIVSKEKFPENLLEKFEVLERYLSEYETEISNSNKAHRC